MSLALTALRLAAIDALNSHLVLARECQGRIFDSDLGDFSAAEPQPTIVVTTEELKGYAYSKNNGGLPFDDACDLRLEIALRQSVEDDGVAGYATPRIDGAMEARLNALVWCAEVMLTRGRPHPIARPTPEGALLLQAVTRRVPERTASRFGTDETGTKFAIHLVTYRVELKNDAPDPRTLPSGPYAVLPDPLRTVALAAKPGSYTEAVCRREALRLAGVLDPPPLLQTARINPAGTTTPIPADPVPSLTIPLAESP